MTMMKSDRKSNTIGELTRRVGVSTRGLETQSESSNVERLSMFEIYQPRGRFGPDPAAAPVNDAELDAIRTRLDQDFDKIFS